jgi:hypothetical protein
MGYSILSKARIVSRSTWVDEYCPWKNPLIFIQIAYVNSCLTNCRSLRRRTFVTKSDADVDSACDSFWRQARLKSNGVPRGSTGWQRDYGNMHGWMCGTLRWAFRNTDKIARNWNVYETSSQHARRIIAKLRRFTSVCEEVFGFKGTRNRVRRRGSTQRLFTKFMKKLELTGSLLCLANYFA